MMPARSVGRGENVWNQPGTSASALARARRARPSGVVSAFWISWCAVATLPAGSVMCTSCRPLSGASSVLTAKLRSSPRFHVPTAPARPPASETTPSMVRLSGTAVRLAWSHRVDMADFHVRPLDETTWPDFARLIEAHHGLRGGCWCMAFHAEGVGRTSPAQNRSEKERRVRKGRAHAALVYDGPACVGWCQFGPTDELPRIKHRRAYLEGLDAR